MAGGPPRTCPAAWRTTGTGGGGSATWQAAPLAPARPSPKPVLGSAHLIHATCAISVMPSNRAEGAAVTATGDPAAAAMRSGPPSPGLQASLVPARFPAAGARGTGPGGPRSRGSARPAGRCVPPFAGPPAAIRAAAAARNVSGYTGLRPRRKPRPAAPARPAPGCPRGGAVSGGTGQHPGDRACRTRGAGARPWPPRVTHGPGGSTASAARTTGPPPAQRSRKRRLRGAGPGPRRHRRRVPGEIRN
jgi:translation initiation factor IF-2